MRKRAVIVIDMQNDFCDQDGVYPRHGMDRSMVAKMIPNLVRLVSEARRKDVPVLFVKTVYESAEELGIVGERRPFLMKEGLRKGSWGSDIVLELKPRPEDIIIEKKRFSAFYQTRLDEALREIGANELIVTGVLTDVCVESTVRDAFFRDYYTVVPSDSVASYRQETHDASLKIMGLVFSKVLGSAQVIETFGN